VEMHQDLDLYSGSIKH